MIFEELEVGKTYKEKINFSLHVHIRKASKKEILKLNLKRLI